MLDLSLAQTKMLDGMRLYHARVIVTPCHFHRLTLRMKPARACNSGGHASSGNVKRFRGKGLRLAP